MTKLTAMPICGKNLKKIFFSGTQKPMTFKFGMQHRVLEYYQTVQMMTLGRPWPISQQGQIWSLMLLFGEKKNKQSIVVYDVKVGRCS